MTLKPIKTELFQLNQNLHDFLIASISTLKEDSVIVIASKLLALSEGRVAQCNSKEEKYLLAKQESEFIIDSKWIPLTITNGILMMAAGIDESNTNNSCLLLAKNAFLSAEKIRKNLMEHFEVKNLGIIISDSRLFPLRQGVTGGAIGYAGFQGLKDYRGKKDLHGRVFKLESLNLADSLASAAILVMGEGAEQQPLAMITDFPLQWTDESPDPDELKIPLEDDLYGPLFGALKK